MRSYAIMGRNKKFVKADPATRRLRKALANRKWREKKRQGVRKRFHEPLEEERQQDRRQSALDDVHLAHEAHEVGGAGNHVPPEPLDRVPDCAGGYMNQVRFNSDVKIVRKPFSRRKYFLKNI